MTDTVLVLAPDFPPSTGGIQIQAHRVASAFSRLVPVVVAPRASDGGAFDTAAPYDVRRVWPAAGASRVRKALLLVTLTLAAVRLAWRRPFRVVLCAHVIAAPCGWFVSRLFGVPYVVWVYADEVVHPWRFWRWALSRADRVIAISGHSRALALQAGAVPERTVIVPCAADLPSLEDAAAAPSVGPIDGHVVLTVSRLDDLYKGHDVVIRSLPIVASRVPDVRYVIVGDGRHAAYYRRLVATLGLEEHVVFTGRTTESARNGWYRRCDVFAMLSRVNRLDGGGEGFGIAFLEANAWEKPVVAGAAGGSVDAVEDGVSGVLVGAEDVHACADALIRLLTDPELCRRLGRQGRTRVEQRFSWPHIASEIERELLATRRHRRGSVADERGAR